MTYTELITFPFIYPQDIVCNDTALQSLTPNTPPYIDLKAVLCGVTDDSWVDRMKARNYSGFELMELTRNIQK